ncbi:MAG TPA: phosphoribosyltransferase family protein [bacterium]|nr:phosphoribosyltransferase family protein [bacterium]
MPLSPETADVVTVPDAGLPGTPEEQALHARLLADPRIRDILIPHSWLQARVAALAEAIARDCGALAELTLLIVLKGAVTFATRLGEALCWAGGPPVRYEFVRASTYGVGIKGPGDPARAVRIELAPPDLAERDVLLVEDLVDQAFTLAHLLRHLRGTARVRSLRTCVLAEKVLARPSPAVQAARAALQLDYVGFRVPDRWIAGYGIDAGEDFRNLPCIVTVNEEHYRA